MPQFNKDAGDAPLADPGGGRSASHAMRSDVSQLASLFRIWIEMERQLPHAELSSAPDAVMSARDEELDAQTAIMNLVAALPARSLSDLLYKMALWRWDTPDLGSDGDQMQRNELLAYSVFRDLVAMTGDDSVLTEDDRADGISDELSGARR